MLRRFTLLLPFVALALPSLAATPATTPAPSIHEELVTTYMSGKWETLEATLKEKASQIAALPRDQAADIAVIHAALAECRPAWWNPLKLHKKMTLNVSMWGRNVPMTFDPESKVTVTLNRVNNEPVLIVNFPTTDMDGLGPTELGPTKGDLSDNLVMGDLGYAEGWSALPPSGIQLDETGKAVFLYYLGFRSAVSAAVYCTPTARRYTLLTSLNGYAEQNAAAPNRNAQKAVATMLLIEILTHPETYPSFTLPKTLPAEDTETALARHIYGVLAKQPWTFAEDKALRSAFKQLGLVNTDKSYASGIIALPNKLGLAIHPDADKTLMAKREAWFKRQLDKLGIKTTDTRP